MSENFTGTVRIGYKKPTTRAAAKCHVVPTFKP